MKRTKLTSCLLAAASTAILVALPALARAECTSPPSGAWALSTTRDHVYPAMWCNNTVFPALFNGLHLDPTDWDEGYGLTEIGDDLYQTNCLANDYLTRLLNGAWIVTDVEKHAVPFGQHRQVSGLNGGWSAWDQGWWWNFASNVEPDEWEPECETDSWATNHTGIDDYIGLKIGGAYKKTAMFRSAIVVHEPTHEEVSHIGGDACDNGASCDTAYGVLNADTMHINFLYDAAGAYKTELYNGQPFRPIQVDGDQCSFIPRFSTNERQEALNKSETDLDSRFESALPPGLVRYASLGDLDAANGTSPFGCQQCDLDKYTFKPNECAQTACNEVLNSNNFGVNLNNRIACAVYNNAVDDDDIDADLVAAAKATMQGNLLACAAPDAQDARAYCDAQKASTNDAQEVDACGWLDQYHGPTLDGQLGCVQEFCQEKWSQSGGWTTGQDPYLCGEYLCGGSACGSAADEVACKKQVVVMHADPDFYVSQCEMDGCKGGLVQCLVALHDQDQWSYGDPIPPSCDMPYQLCVMAQKLASMVWTEYRPWTDPGPLREIQPDLASSQPAKHWNTLVQNFRDAVARGERDEELERLARGLTSNPEMVVALYHAAPGEFVGLFGKEGFAELLGPGLARVEAKALDRDLLSPQGQAALDELQRLLATTRDGKVKGAIGTIGVPEQR